MTHPFELHLDTTNRRLNMKKLISLQEIKINHHRQPKRKNKIWEFFNNLIALFDNKKFEEQKKLYPDLLFEYESSIILEFSRHNKDIGFKFKFFSSCLTTVHVVYTHGPPTQMMIFFFFLKQNTK